MHAPQPTHTQLTSGGVNRGIGARGTGRKRGSVIAGPTLGSNNACELLISESSVSPSF